MQPYDDSDDSDSDAYAAPPAPAKRILDINDEMRHELIGVPWTFNAFVARELAICAVLLEATSKAHLVASLEPLVTTTVRGDLDWDVIWDTSQRKQLMLHGVNLVLREIEAFTQMSEMTSIPTFLSVLRWSKLDDDTDGSNIMFMVTARPQDHNTYYDQISIVKPPSMWMYAVSHPDIPCLSAAATLSMLLHSITSYAMKELYPLVRHVRIPSPYPRMRAIMVESSRVNDFQLQILPDGIRIDLDTQHNYLSLWRKWIAPTQSCNSCLAQVQWACSGCDVATYCSDACAEEHWPMHAGVCMH